MAEKTVLISQQHLKPIKILKWKVSEGSTLSIGSVLLLYDFEGDEKVEQRKLKSTHAGTILRLIVQEGAIVKTGEQLLEVLPCIHPTIMRDMCAECGADLRKDDLATTASVPMVHSIPELKVSEELAQKIGKADGDRLLKDRKLVLLVDLDQTVIHTTNDNIPPNIKDVYHFQLYGPNSPWYHTRLRPGTHNFLKNVSSMFELHICTFGARNYAHTITMFLDRDQSYFSNRILSRDECFDPTSKKANLKALFPCGDNMVCIIDDREDVWSHATNLIHVKPYHFFQHTGDINAPPGLDKHENDDKEGVDLTKIKVKNKKKVNGTITVENEDIIESNALTDSTNNLVENTNGNPANLETSNQEDVNNGDKTQSVSCTAKAKDEDVDNKETLSNKVLPEVNEKDETACNNNVAAESKENINKVTAEKNEEEKSEVLLEPENEDKSKEVKKSDLEQSNDECVDGKLNNSKEDVPSIVEEPKKSEDDLIEIDDPDDYLMYLEDILKRIHQAFYEEYDKMESGAVPDLKKVIPTVRSTVLKDTKLVFSGLVPTHIKLEQSKAYLVARSLGAIVTQDLEDSTTHLVAVRPGTAKVNAGRKKKNLKIVTPDWLWACAERWEHVDERIYPLNSKGSKNRHPPPHCSSPEHAPNYPVHDMPGQRKRTPSGRFMDTINPLMSFSKDDIMDMDKEVEEICQDDEDESESDDGEKTQKKEILKRKKEDDSSSSSEESMTGEFPRGFKRLREESDRDKLLEDDLNDSSLDEYPSAKFRRGEKLDSDLDIGQESNSDGSDEPPDEVDDGEWNMMGAQLEREFLSNN